MKVINKFKSRRLTLDKCKAGEVVSFPAGFYQMGASGSVFIISNKDVFTNHECQMRTIIDPVHGRIITLNNTFYVKLHDAELVIKGVIE